MLLSCTILGVPVSLTNVVNFDVGKERGRFFKLSSTLTSESELIDARYISGSRRGKLLARKNYQRDIVYGKTILGVKLLFFLRKGLVTRKYSYIDRGRDTRSRLPNKITTKPTRRETRHETTHITLNKT